MFEKWSGFRARLLELYPILRPENPVYRWLVLASVMIGTFMGVLDATIVNVALSKLMSSFGVPVDTVEWVLTAYLLVFAVTLPSSGWMADHFGSKKMFISGIFIFTLGSFLSSLAWDFNILIIFRIIQGFGAGILMPVGMAILTREFPPEQRGIALAFWSVSASASVSLGPALGGYLIDHYSWHAIFDVNVPVGLMGVVILMIILREQKTGTQGKFDIVGFVSLSVFLGALLLALANGNSAWNTGGWTSNYIIFNFALSGVGLLVFLVNEFSIEHPLIQIGLFRNFNFAVSNVVLFIFGLGVFGSIFLFPIYLQNSLGYTPFQAGIVFLPVGIIQGLSAPVAGVFSDKYTPKIPAFIGMLLMAFSFYKFGFLSLYSEKAQIMFPLYIRGIAMGILFAPLTTIAISEMKPRQMAQASGLLNVIRQIGGSFGVAIFGSILTQRTIYHMAIFSQQANPHSPAFSETIMRLQHFVMQKTSSIGAMALEKAQALIASFMSTQAFIGAVDDLYLIASIIVLISAFPILITRSHRVNYGSKHQAKTQKT